MKKSNSGFYKHRVKHKDCEPKDIGKYQVLKGTMVTSSSCLQVFLLRSCSHEPIKSTLVQCDRKIVSLLQASLQFFLQVKILKTANDNISRAGNLHKPCIFCRKAN